MRFIGFREGQADTTIGVVKDKRVAPLTDVSGFYADLPRWRAAAMTAEPTIALDKLQLTPAIWPGARVLCVGLNYRAHAAEGGFPIPDYPAIFGRWTRSLITDGDWVPVNDPKLDWECELGVVVGDTLANVNESEALAGVFGYAPFNDISARTYQRHTPQWTTGKNMDRSGVVGAIVTVDEVGNPGDGLRIQTRLNGEVMQSASTDDMIFSVPKIISYLSEIMTLHPGDLIVTGTPKGVGHARTPPHFMVAGDVVEVEIERIGTIRNPIVSATRDLV